MGVGRRMKKQGPPEPLPDARTSTSVKKRKASAAPDTNGAGKKRRTGAKKTFDKAPPKTSNGLPKKTPSVKVTDSKSSRTEKSNRSAKPAKSGQRAAGVIEDSEDDSAISDGIGALNDIVNESASELGDDSLDDDVIPGDEFLDSNSSVYDSDAGQTKAIFSEDDSDSEAAEEKLTAANIAGLSRKLDSQTASTAAAAQAELEEAALQTNIAGGDDDVDENGNPASVSAALAPSMQFLRSRITQTIQILTNLSTNPTPNRSRADHTAQLLEDISTYYGYSPFLAEKLFNLFSPAEAFAFFEANETPRPVVIRTNTLRTHRRELAQALLNRGVTLEPVGKWSKVGLQIFESPVPLGATPEYLAGHYMLQAASSFLPVMALSPQPHERILDMAAAPGGKTTHMAALMANTGVIFANDASKPRTKALIGNIHRLGARNTIVSNADALTFPGAMAGFDRVLLDAPCSGTGVIAKDPTAKTHKTPQDFLRLPHAQKRLLLHAIDAVDHRKAGAIVYSTCSVAVEENEAVVAYALRKRPNVRLVDTGLSFGVDGFAAYMGKDFGAPLRLTKRFYPHKYNVDGFFVARFHKFGPSPPGAVGMETKPTAAAAANGGGLGDADANGTAGAASATDKAPIRDDEKEDGEDFGGWDDDEADKKYIERALRSAARRKGIDPRTIGRLNIKGAEEGKKSKAKKRVNVTT
ncbi:MAG: hypothetical protein M1825_005541 [Sarcosagium campestre]|nr:MAG: hypothetical protein M1825_005541 [Sarcosagium campestre]